MKFAAFFEKKEENKETFFLALDKCMPRKEFLQILKVKQGKNGIEFDFNQEIEEKLEEKHEEIELFYDEEWLAILSVIEDFYRKIREKGHLFDYSKENPYSLKANFNEKSEEFEDLLKKIKEKKEDFKGKETKIVENCYWEYKEHEINKQTEKFLQFICLKKEIYEGFLFEKSFEKTEKIEEKEKKFIGNTEEISLDLAENNEENKEEFNKGNNEGNNEGINEGINKGINAEINEKKKEEKWSINIEETPFFAKKEGN